MLASRADVGVIVDVPMKSSDDHRQPVRYGITPAAFQELALLMVFAFWLGIPWLLQLFSWLQRLISGLLGF